MKGRLLAYLLCCVLLLGCAFAVTACGDGQPAGSSASSKRTYDNVELEGGVVRGGGNELTVMLGVNCLQGYEWECLVIGDQCKMVDSDVMYVSEGEQPPYGGEATFVAVFRCSGEGEAVATLNLLAPETRERVRTEHLKIISKEDGTIEKVEKVR